MSEPLARPTPYFTRNQKAVIMGALILISALSISFMVARSLGWIKTDSDDIRDRIRAAKVRRGEDPNKKEASPQWEWFHVSAKEIASEYRSNEMAAQQKYVGLHLAVSGIVQQVVGQPGVTSFVLLDGGIQCQIKPNHESIALALQRGDRVELLGLCEGTTSDYIMLSDCGIIRQP